MTDTSPTDDRPTHHRKAATILLVVVIAVGSLTGFVIAQESGETFSDDFEDGDVDGWENIQTDTSADISPESFDDQYSLYGGSTMIPEDETERPSFDWQSGPVLDLQDQFVVRGTFKYEIGDTSASASNVRIGLTGDDQAELGENAFLLFDYGSDETRIGTSIHETGGDAISNDFRQSEWVRFEMYSPAANSTIRAKVWEANSAEPGDYQISRTGLDAETGQFGVNPGESDAADRQMWLDDVTIDGTEATDPNLSIETSSLLPHGETQPYSVERTVYDENLRKNVTRDVTDDADVESLNPEGLTVNEDNHTLTATSDEEFQDRVTVRAAEGGSVTHTEVAVADVSMENIEILPPEYRFAALLGAGAFQAILISVFAAIVGTRWSTAFGGLGMMQLVLVAGWFGGWVSTGIVLVGLFTAMFIGLNLAANIDYTVRR